MPNVFASVKEIARQALPRLIENLVFPHLCYNDFSDAFEAGKGTTIQVRKPVIFTASDFDQGTGIVAQDLTENTVDVTLDKLASVDVKVSSIESATSVDNLKSQFIEPAAVALAEKINGDGLAMARFVNNTIGTAGTTPDGLDDFANAAEILNNAKAPMLDRYGVWNPAANAKFQQIGDIINAEKSGSNEALRAGAIGDVFGLQNYMSQGVKKTTLAGAGTVLVDHSGGYAAGTTEIHVDGVSTALAAGDTIKIGNYLYTVASAGTLSTADQDITLCNGLVANVANDATVTLIAANTVQNMVFHKNAFAFVTRPLAVPAGVESYTTTFNGISLRVVRGYDMTYKQEVLSMDVLYGYKAIYPELAVRVLG